MDYLKRVIISSKFDQKKKNQRKDAANISHAGRGIYVFFKNSKRASLTTLYR